MGVLVQFPISQRNAMVDWLIEGLILPHVLIFFGDGNP